MSAEDERKRFWGLFDEILKEKGNPFQINYKMNGDVKFWASINNENCMCENALELSFLCRYKKLRIDFYFRNGIDSSVSDNFLNHKEEIENLISVPLLWEYGTKNEKTLRPSYYIKFQDCYLNYYKETIEKAIPIIMEFIKVGEIYGQGKLFNI